MAAVKVAIDKALYGKIKNPVMTKLAARIENVHLRDSYPRDLGDLFDGDQIVLVGRYSAADVEKLDRREEERHSTLVVTGIYEGREKGFEYPVAFRPAGRRGGYEFVEKLWAVRRVGWLLDQIQLHGEAKEVIDELVRLSKQYGIMTPYTSFLADENAPLSRPEILRGRADVAAKALSEGVTGPSGQLGAMNRQALNMTARPPAPSAPGGGSGWVFGNTAQDRYEKGEKEKLENFRQAGDQAMYRRSGRVWIAANAADVDPEKDTDKIKTIDRFSEEYFELARANSVVENQAMASQQAGEELVIRLRDQVYRIR